MQRFFRPPHASVIHEVIDGEAIIMDLRTGHYFSSDGIGALLWSALADGHSVEALIAALAAAYPKQDVALAVETYLADLCGAELLARVEPGGQPGGAPLPVFHGAFSTPRLEIHTDLADVVKLDPIHDVEETRGWPVVRRA
jgi:hypothetical protein